MLEGIDILRELNLISVFVRIVVSLVIGGALGLERGRKNRAAGFRTYTLVCLGSALVMMTNQYVSTYFGSGDPTRLGAQVISGIGFLGAGTILLTGRNQVRGITTAAGLWAAACCGLAIGIGFYEGAFMGGLTILVVMAALSKVDAYFRSRAKQIDVYVEFSERKALRVFIEYCRNHNYEIHDLHLTTNKNVKDSPLSATLAVIADKRIPHVELLAHLHEVDGVLFMEEI